MQAPEQWRAVAGWPGYEVSTLGRVRHAVRGMCGSTLDSRGYPRVSLSLNGLRRKARVHRLVAIAFLPNPLDLPQVDHLNCDKTDAALSNLEWVSNRENMNRAIAAARVPRGAQRNTAKLQDIEVALIRNLRTEGTSVASLSVEFGIAKQNIYALLSGKTWSHIGDKNAL